MSGTVNPAYLAQLMRGTSVDAAFIAAGRPVTLYSIRLADDIEVKGYKTRQVRDGIGSEIVKLTLTRPASGEATLVIRDGRVTGRVRVGGRDFAISASGKQRATISEYDMSKRPHRDPTYPPIKPGASTFATPSAAPGALSPAGPANPVTINVAILYTPAANAQITDLLASASLAISYTNDAFANSGAYVQFNLVGVVPFDYDEAGMNSPAILNDIMLNSVAAHQVRDNLRADLVSVWSVFTDACGYAEILDGADSYDASPYGYNVISLSYGHECLTDGFAHEHGHNLGSLHDRYKDDPQDLDTTHYNYGYVDTAHMFRTIMSYPDACTAVGVYCSVLPYYSNPNLTYNGAPLGIPDSSPKSADSTRRMNEIAPYVEKFRSGVPMKSVAYSSVLPSSRSISLNQSATFFMAIANAGLADLTNCSVPSMSPVTGGVIDNLDWQTTNPATNQPVGQKDSAFTVPAGQNVTLVMSTQSQSYVQAPAAYKIAVTCDNVDGPQDEIGVNTLDFSVSATPVPDVIVLAATTSNNGILTVPVSGSSAFAVASINIGAAGALTFSADTGGVTLPISLSLCETVPSTGQCKAAPASSVSRMFVTGETPTFGIFATGSGAAVPFSPAVNRIFVHFIDGNGGSHGSSSVAVQTN